MKTRSGIWIGLVLATVMAFPGLTRADEPNDLPGGSFAPPVVPPVFRMPGDGAPVFQVPESIPTWVSDVIARPTFQRFIGPVRIDTTKTVYDRLLDHLSLSSELSRALDIGRYFVTEDEGDTRVDDGRGAKAVLNQIYAAEGHRIYAGKGAFELPLLPDATGVGVVEVRYYLDGDVLVSQARLSFLVDGRVYPTLTRMALSVLEKEVDERLFVFVHCANELSERIAEDAAAVARAIPAPALLISYRKVFRDEISRSNLAGGAAAPPPSPLPVSRRR